MRARHSQAGQDGHDTHRQNKRRKKEKTEPASRQVHPHTLTGTARTKPSVDGAGVDREAQTQSRDRTKAQGKREKETANWETHLFLCHFGDFGRLNVKVLAEFDVLHLAVVNLHGQNEKDNT